MCEGGVRSVLGGLWGSAVGGAARFWYISTHIREDWRHGRARLYSPPVDMLPLFVRKLETERGKGVLLAPKWPAKPWFARLRWFASKMVELEQGEGNLWN